MLTRSEGLSFVPKDDVLYVMPVTGPSRFRPLVLMGPAVAAFEALEEPADEEAVVAALLRAYPDEARETIMGAVEQILASLAEVGVLTEVHSA